MKKILTLILFVCLGALLAKAQLSPNQWSDYKGLMSKTNISLSLYLGDNGKVTGTYCYAKYDKRIALTGNSNGRDITLFEMHQGKQTATLKGTLLTDSTDHFKGTWSDGKITMPFDVHLSCITAGSPTKRYNDTEANDTTVENYMKKVKTAIVNQNKAWLSTQVTYPFTVFTPNGKTKNLKNKQEFISNYKLIVSESLKKRIADICTCHLFMNYRGVMLGNGEVWINERPGSKGIFFIAGFMPI
jgi:hypothetical protein